MPKLLSPLHRWLGANYKSLGRRRGQYHSGWGTPKVPLIWHLGAIAPAWYWGYKSAREKVSAPPPAGGRAGRIPDSRSCGGQAVGVCNDKETQAKRVSPRRQEFAERAAEQLRRAEACRFSFLPFEELKTLATGWHDACAEGMLQGNFTRLDDWLRGTIGVASEQGFGLDDLLVLLQTCRRVAVKEIGWQEDLLADLDITINESLAYMRSQVSWEIPEGLDYRTGKNDAERAAEPVTEEERGERRGHNRSQLSLPIRVRATARGWKVEEFNKTANVARGGVYFSTRHTYTDDMQVLVTYPYSDAPDAINRDYPAEVVRLDKLENGRTGVALRFKVGLGPKKQSASA